MAFISRLQVQLDMILSLNIEILTSQYDVCIHNAIILHLNSLSLSLWIWYKFNLTSVCMIQYNIKKCILLKLYIIWYITWYI